MDKHKINLYKDLLNDEQYQQALKTIPESEQEKVNEYMKEYMDTWQKKLIDPLLENMEDPEFVKEVIKKLEGYINTENG